MSSTHCMSYMKLIAIDEQESEHALFLKNFYKSDTGDAAHDHSRILFFGAQKKNETEYRVRVTPLHYQLKSSQICYSSSGSSFVHRTCITIFVTHVLVTCP